MIHLKPTLNISSAIWHCIIINFDTLQSLNFAISDVFLPKLKNGHMILANIELILGSIFFYTALCIICLPLLIISYICVLIQVSVSHCSSPAISKSTTIKTCLQFPSLTNKVCLGKEWPCLFFHSLIHQSICHTFEVPQMSRQTAHQIYLKFVGCIYHRTLQAW